MGAEGYGLGREGKGVKGSWKRGEVRKGDLEGKGGEVSWRR